MKILQLDRAHNEHDIWGNYTWPQTWVSAVVIGYYDANGTPLAGESIALYVLVGTAAEHKMYCMLSRPGDIIPAYIDGVGPVYQLLDSGCRIRVVGITAN